MTCPTWQSDVLGFELKKMTLQDWYAFLNENDWFVPSVANYFRMFLDSLLDHLSLLFFVPRLPPPLVPTSAGIGGTDKQPPWPTLVPFTWSQPSKSTLMSHPHLHSFQSPSGKMHSSSKSVRIKELAIKEINSYLERKVKRQNLGTIFK